MTSERKNPRPGARRASRRDYLDVLLCVVATACAVAGYGFYFDLLTK
jgi:hypothetical protein